jgi:phage major head subunit gpT-like protein
MILNTTILQKALNSQFEQQYRNFMQSPEVMRAMAMMTVTRSTKASEDFAWLGDLPGMKEWIGTKDLGGISDYDFTIKNKDWYTGFSIDRNEIEDDQVGAIMPRVAAMAQVAALWPYRLVLQLLDDGDSGLAYDGSAFFANRSVNDNLLSGSGVDTLAHIKTDIQTATTTLRTMKTDTGEYMNLRPTLLVCPPAVEFSMIEALQTPGIINTGTGATVNPLSSLGIQVVSFPELSDADDWYLLCTDRPLKPFIFQQRKAPTAVFDGTEEADSRKMKYSVEMRGNAGYGFPQMAVKVVNS